MNGAPCNGCPDRRIGCHGKCAMYQAFAKARERERQYKRLAMAGRPEKQRLAKYIKESNKHYKSKGAKRK